jgi:hypothetical protein
MRPVAVTLRTTTRAKKMKTTIGVVSVVSLAGALLLVSAAQVTAQVNGWVLENQGYYDATLAEPRAAQTQVLFPARADSFPFAVNDRSSWVWDISVGKEVPVLGFDTNKADSTPSGVAPGAFGIGLWFPLSFHMIEDIGKDPSNPILNTDYRFGGLVKVQVGLPRDVWWSTAHVGAKFQVGHESTHIGDEFTLGALRTHSAQFLRVNVSYEYYEVAGSFEPNFGRDGRYQLKLRGGIIWLWHPSQGWYDRELLQPYGTFIAGSQRNHEPYVQAELNVSPAALRWGPLGLIFSADLRDRTIYQYVVEPDASHSNPSEPSDWSTNVIAGLRQNRMLGKVTPTYYFRVYQGVNPNGQFRSQSNYHEFGLGVQFGF